MVNGIIMKIYKFYKSIRTVPILFIMDDNLLTDFVFVPEIQDKISCITGDKNNIYIANEKENRIYRYAKEIITIQ